MNWNEHRETIIERLKEGIKPPEIADELGVSEYDLRQFLHRNRLFDSRNKGRNLAFEMISILMRGNPDYFKPNRTFFNTVKIGQKRWWQLYRGDKKMTEKEYKTLVSHLGITLEEALDARQLNWIEELEQNK